MSIVQLNKMRNIRILWLSLCAAMVVSSCIKEDEVETSPLCYITSFSVGDIKTELTVKLANGNDTVITKTIGGDEIYFNTNQIQKTIWSVDTLPNWVDLTKVIPTVGSSGYVFIKESDDETFMTFNNGVDTVDFTKPVEFKVIATDGISSKTYTAHIFQHEDATDSLVWNKVSGVDLTLEGKHRTLLLEDRIYVFAENNGSPSVTSSSFLSEGASWRKTAALPEGIDWQSITVFNNKMYAINTEGYICSSTNDERGETWSVVSDQKFVRLLSADNLYLYAYDGEKIMGTTDLQNWIACGNSDLDMLPEGSVASMSYQTKTNTSLYTAVMGGLNANNSDKAVMWYKISSLDESINQSWSYIQVTADNSYGLPALDNLSIVHYDRTLMAIGGDYEGIYLSKDNGITWRLQTTTKLLPEDMQKDAPASMVIGNGYLWIIQSGGNVWKGKL